MQTELTLETAKAYVLGHHETNGESVAIEGAGIFTNEHGVEIARLNVTTSTGEALQWDVWSEPLMGGALYGEC